MCGIVAALHLAGGAIPNLGGVLSVANRLQAHRGPDGSGTWLHPDRVVGLGHRRLSILDIESGAQPMTDGHGTWISYNGQVYNFVELRQQLSDGRFVTRSDTEVLLHAWKRWGGRCVERFRGMFAFALWDEPTRTLFCARDRCGIKPLYYAVAGGVLYVASEIKALLPFLPAVETDLDALKDYLTFQFCLGDKTLFKGVRQLLPGHTLVVRDGTLRISRYWDVAYHADQAKPAAAFREELRALLEESVDLHLRADVPIGVYVSGGIDSSAIASLAARGLGSGLVGIVGKFPQGAAFDESRYARDVAALAGFPLHEVAIGERDFVDTLPGLVYHLDQPAAGPGSFPQYVVARAASRERKVMLAGQGGDELFGGYARYLITYFEQCLQGTIDGSDSSGRLVAACQSMLPGLVALREYQPLLEQLWREGPFGAFDERYFRLIDRGAALRDEIRWEALGTYSPLESFRQLFHDTAVGKQSDLDTMTHFDYQTLLPALLQVEDRVSMAHGVESRVPLLDHRLIELAATIPASLKLRDGEMKHALRDAAADLLPPSVKARRDKMGFPVPLHDWLAVPGIVPDFVRDVLSSRRALEREWIDNRLVADRLADEPRFGRKLWGLLNLELWQQAFHDRSSHFRTLLAEAGPEARTEAIR